MPEGWIEDPAMKTTTAFQLLIWAAAMSCDAQPITVRVYDYTGLSAARWAETADLAGRVMEKAGHQVTWLTCGGTGLAVQPEALCATALGDSDYVLRLVSGDGTQEHGGKQRLASALLDHASGGYATLLTGAIRAHAAYLGVSSNILLSYAAAHELMHLIHGPAHASSGLMKASWTRKDAEDIMQMRLAVRVPKP